MGDEAKTVEGKQTDVDKKRALRDLILQATDIEEKVIVVKDWGNAKILIRSLTAGEGGSLFAKARKDSEGNMDSQDLAMRLIIFACRHPETKKRLFGDLDLEALSGKSLRAVQGVAQEIMQMSGMDSGALETAEKN